VTIEVLARPGSRRLGLLRVEPRGLVIGVASQAEKGKANDELMASIAKMAGVARSAVSVLRGATSRDKIVRIAGAKPSALAERILIEAAKVAKQK